MVVPSVMTPHSKVNATPSHLARPFATASGAWITSRLTHTSFAARSTDELAAEMRRAFAGFGASARLIQSMLHSPQGVEVRVRQQPARQAMFAACVDAAVPEAPADVRERAAAALQVLYSAPSWDLLRTFWHMDASQAADTIELAIRSLLAGLPAAYQERTPT
jgi:hypothetical protein